MLGPAEQLSLSSCFSRLFMALFCAQHLSRDACACSRWKGLLPGRLPRKLLACVPGQTGSILPPTTWHWSPLQLHHCSERGGLGSTALTPSTGFPGRQVAQLSCAHPTLQGQTAGGSYTSIYPRSAQGHLPHWSQSQLLIEPEPSKGLVSAAKSSPHPQIRSQDI